MTEVIGWILAAFVIYMLMMIAIGAVYSKKNSSTADYFLGGRKLGGFVAALSAQASDMSGWLLMGLPGAIMVTGLCGDGWVALGLLIGTILNWLIVASRLRKYTIKANNSLTLPMFFENRFRDKKKILMGISSIIIVIFFLFYWKKFYLISLTITLYEEPSPQITSTSLPTSLPSKAAPNEDSVVILPLSGSEPIDPTN